MNTIYVEDIGRITIFNYGVWYVFGYLFLICKEYLASLKLDYKSLWK